MRFQVAEGDLLDQEVDAIVNAWNRNTIPWWLLLPQGVSGAIKKRGGVQPFRELAARGRMDLGSAVSTGSGKLPFKAIIHVAGINDLWQGSEQTTRLCVRSTVAEAERLGLDSIAFPLIGSGSGGLGPETVRSVMIEELEQIPSSIGAVLVLFKPDGGS